MGRAPQIFLPEYAYIPGQNNRHPEDSFDDIRRTAAPGLDASQLARCHAFCAGLQYYHSGYYWEAHEVLEPVWMHLPDGGEERLFVQGLIQLANGRLKLRMGRPKAAQRLVAKARALVPVDGQESIIMTIKVCEVHAWIDALETDAYLAL